MRNYFNFAFILSIESDPPTYEQAIIVNADDKKFSPNYPVYRRATSYSSNTSNANE